MRNFFASAVFVSKKLSFAALLLQSRGYITLWDEDDTIYCSVCHHRTNKENGEDDLVECPYCHRMRDRKAYYCRYCNDSTWEPSTPKEFKEIDTDLKEMGY